jgi:hypothetical protein
MGTAAVSLGAFASSLGYWAGPGREPLRRRRFRHFGRILQALKRAKPLNVRLHALHHAPYGGLADPSMNVDADAIASQRRE